MSDVGLYDRPVLVLDPGMHTAPIRDVDVDGAGRFAVTASEDKTLRVWSLTDGCLLRTIRLPAGPGSVGRAYAVAISPNGATIAAGGWTRRTAADPAEQLYLFDRDSGAMIDRITGLPTAIGGLAFDRSGRRLAAALGQGGLRLYACGGTRPCLEIAADVDYGDSSYGVAFDANDHLATTSWDGRLRFYDADGALLRSIATPHARPTRLAFNPKDGRLAVGFSEVSAVALYDGTTHAPLLAPDLRDIDNGSLDAVAWSTDGATLFAGGQYMDASGCPILAWRDGGAGQRAVLPAGSSSVRGLRGLVGDALVVAAADPFLGVLAADGSPHWTEASRQMDPRGQMSNLALSPDGMLVEIGLRRGGDDRLRFDLAALDALPPANDGRALPPRQDGLVTSGSDLTVLTNPTVNGTPLPLHRHELARCMAIHPDGDRLLLGTEWSLRAFDKTPAALWARAVPGIVWAVNISGDGRLAVAACGDGTLRWHRMEDGAELLALFVLPDQENWVAWTAEGIYAASPGARRVLRWHVNHGWDAPGEAIPVDVIPETYRPDVIRHVLPQMGTPGALAVTELAKIRGAVQRATGADVAPGARLHVLAIGVSDHGPAARNLDLAYADQDARDLSAALRDSQGGLYAQVLASELTNADATRAMILSELGSLRDSMKEGNGQDLAVVLFSGHGEIVDEDELYLIPHGVDTSSRDALIAGAIDAGEFHGRIAKIAEHGRVILFLDACFSGGATVPLDRSLRAMLRAPNLSVFASSTAREASLERGDWQNGALTEALLAALREADRDHDGLIRISDLMGYLAERIPGLTADKQHPEVEVHFDRKVLAAML